MLRWKSLVLVAALFIGVPVGVGAQEWGEFAYISSTIGVHDSRICTGEYSRGALGCAANAPYVSRATGALGLGTAQPSATLHVAGTIRIASGAEACDADRLGAIKYENSNFYVCRDGANWETLVASTTGTVQSDRITSGTTGMYTYNNTSASIATAGVERMVVGTAGYVGINQQPIPGSFLSVSGTTTLRARVTNASSVWYRSVDINGYDGLADNATDGLARLSLSTGDTMRASIQSGRDMTTGTGYDGYLSFSTRNEATAPYMHERMRINSNGSVGIGQMPAAGITLAVSGTNEVARFGWNSLINQYLTVRNVSAGTTLGLSTAFSSGGDAVLQGGTNKGIVFMVNQAEFASGTTPAMRIDAFGNVGIGLNSPTTKLEVSGTVSGTQLTTPLLQLKGVSSSVGVSMTGGGADNLGNHTASQSLDMAGNSIVSASNIAAAGSVKAGDADTVCSSTDDYGKLRFNPATKKMFLCRP